MSRLTLIIGNKNYSSWSLRPWLALSHFRIPFDEVRVHLGAPDVAAQLAALSPTGLVPVLRDAEVDVWDSLAICEYAAERFPDKPFWPSDRAARAMARSVTAEMHSGFHALRKAMPMNCRARGRRVPVEPGVARDIERIQALWRECRSAHGGDGAWLFGRFCVADAFYAPVALRFRTYDVACDATARAYVEAVAAHPSVARWLADAAAEPERIEACEVGTAISGPPQGKE